MHCTGRWLTRALRRATLTAAAPPLTSSHILCGRVSPLLPPAPRFPALTRQQLWPAPARSRWQLSACWPCWPAHRALPTGGHRSPRLLLARAGNVLLRKAAIQPEIRLSNASCLPSLSPRILRAGSCCRPRAQRRPEGRPRATARRSIPRPSAPPTRRAVRHGWPGDCLRPMPDWMQLAAAV